MPKPKIMLGITTVIVIIGLFTTFYGNHILLEDTVREQKDVMGTQEVVQIEVKESGTEGIYAIEVLDYNGEDISAHVLNPDNKEVESHRVDTTWSEGKFTADMPGVYTLVVKNAGTDPVRIYGGIGLAPHANEEMLAYISQYILTIGVIGVIISMVYAIRQRKSV